jgi:hypothetical protein
MRIFALSSTTSAARPPNLKESTTANGESTSGDDNTKFTA